jgi:myo-inositol-1(or 4)-monophosphatase
MNVNLPETVEFVRNLVQEQAQLALNRWSSVGSIVYKNQRDFVTEVDLEIENSLIAGLGSRFPLHGFCGEETPSINANVKHQWLIDPIDGTKYYAAHSSLFAISVALFYRGEPLLGVVHAPASGQCFHAYRGGGAFLDELRLSGPKARDLSSAIVNIDTPQSYELPALERSWFERKLIELTRRVYRVRMLGISSLGACWIASGALDAYVDLTGYVIPQDIAAGRIIMQEAGVRLAAIDPPAGPPRLAAAAPHILQELMNMLNSPPNFGREGTQRKK